jgi:hypothetical protein
MMQAVSGVLAQYDCFLHTTVTYKKLVFCVIVIYNQSLVKGTGIVDH